MTLEPTAEQKLKVSEAWRIAFQKPDRRPIHVWAEENVRLPAGLQRDEFRIANSRHFIEPLEALANDHVREVAVMKPIRGGGTMLADIWHAWTRANDPGPQAAVLDTEPGADDHAEKRLIPLMESVPQVQAVMPLNPYHKRKNEILFADGLPLYVIGPAIGNLQRRSIRYMSIDEVWLMEEGIVEQAIGRLGDYWKLRISKLLLISQGGVIDDEFDQHWRKGTQRVWSFPCLKCGCVQTVKRWQNKRGDGSRWGIVWDEYKDKAGNWIIAKCLETVRFECFECKHPHMDVPQTKIEWNAAGYYVRTNQDNDPGCESFVWPGLIDWAWGDLLRKFLRAANRYHRKDATLLISYLQKYSPEPATEGSVFEDNDPFGRVDFSTEDAADYDQWFMTIDCQIEDVYWVLICCWSKDGRVRRRWFGQLFSFADCDAKREEWKIPKRHVLVDSRYRPRGPNGVYAACAKYGWLAVRSEQPPKGKRVEFRERRTRFRNGEREFYTVMKSHSSVDPKHCIRVDPEEGHHRRTMRRQEIVMVRYCAATMKDRSQDLVDSRLWAEDVGEADDMDREFRKQFAAEYRKEEVTPQGRMISFWVTRDKNNHGRDLAAMQCLAATIKGILQDKDEAEKEKEKTEQ